MTPREEIAALAYEVIDEVFAEEMPDWWPDREKMSEDIADKVLGAGYVKPPEGTYWVITYFGTGMSPLTAHFEDEALARETWEAWKADPYKGASSIVQITPIDRK